MSMRNFQLVPMINNNNSLEHGLELAIEWFNEIEQSWNIKSVPDGKLYSCNTYCGK